MTKEVYYLKRHYNYFLEESHSLQSLLHSLVNRSTWAMEESQD